MTPRKVSNDLKIGGDNSLQQVMGRGFSDLEAVGDGAFRKVFILSDRFVLKVAKRPLGRESNRLEVEFWTNLPLKDRRHFAGIVAYSEDYTFVIQQRVDVIFDELYESDPRRRRFGWFRFYCIERGDGFNFMALRSRRTARAIGVPQKLINQMIKYDLTSDMHSQNFGRTKAGVWKVIDYAGSTWS